MSRIWSRKEYWVCGVLMVLGILAYSALYLLNVYPFTEGWGIYYAELLSRGQIPYRDFFFYLPPLSLFNDWLFWTLSFGSLLAFRMWYLLQRVVMVWLLYHILTKWFAPRYAWIACLTGIILRTAIVWDLGGDYNQTQTLFAVFLIYAVVWFLEKDADAPVNSIGRYKYIFLAGMIISSMVLLKQSAGLAALIMCFVFLIVYCIVFRDKRFIQYCIATAAGALIPLFVCLGWLTYHDALFPFIEQFFGVAGAKGGIGTILFAGWRVVLTHWRHILMYLAFIMMSWSLLQYAKKKIPGAIAIGHILLFIVSCIACYYDAFVWFFMLLKRSTTLTLAVFALLLTMAVMAWKGDSKILKPASRGNYAGYTALVFAAVLTLLTLNIKNITTSLYRETSLFVDPTAVVTYFALYTAILCVVFQFANYASSGTVLYTKAMTFLFVGGLADAYANIMNASDSIYPVTAFIVGSAFICLLFQLDLKKWNKVKNLLVCVMCVVLCGCVMIQKYTTAYSWWGSEVTYTLNERTESVDLPEMAGLRLAEQRKLEFEQITKVITENDDEDSTVWGFPHVKIFNILTDHYNTEDPVPVLFYDVCSDDAALREAAWLRENYPDFVVWCDMPWCIEVHEETFRNGEPLGQREIISWFTEVRDTDYVKIGQAGNLFVYKLKDGSPINYTYFQDPNAKNGTAGE